MDIIGIRRWTFSTTRDEGMDDARHVTGRTPTSRLATGGRLARTIGALRSNIAGRSL